MWSVAEGGEAFMEVGFAHFVVEVQDADGVLWCFSVVEWWGTGAGGGDDGEEDGALSGFGWGVQADGSGCWDEWPGDPLFVVVGLGPEGVPVDEVGELVDGVAPAGGVWGEVGDGMLPVEVVGDVFAFGGEPDVVGDASVGEELGDVFGVGVTG